RGHPAAAYRRDLPGFRALPDARGRKRRCRRCQPLRGRGALARGQRQGHGQRLHRQPASRLRNPTRQVVQRRPRTLRRPMAEDRPGPCLHALARRHPGAGRTHRCDGCASRSHHLRTLPRTLRWPHRHPDLAPLLHRAHGRPDHRDPGRPHHRARQPCAVDGGGRALCTSVFVAGAGVSVIRPGWLDPARPRTPCFASCLDRNTRMSSRYNAVDIEVLSGLDPVKRRPGMYTDTSRPNHLVQEVVDNSVDEALAGHATSIEVLLHADGSVSVSDDGRGMPVDIHPEEGVSGVELIMTRLHAGGKFSGKNYSFSGGLHGVGVSVVNALSDRVEVTIRRDGSEYAMAFEHGDKVSQLEVIGTVPKKRSGTTLHFWPEAKYFDSPKISLGKLKHLLRAKAVLCAGLNMKLTDEASGEIVEWHYEDGLRDYLRGELDGNEVLPNELFVHQMARDAEGMEVALAWLPEGELVQESYVNLIPTAQGGTHVNGLRTGLTTAIREFCDIRNLLPRGVKLAPEDVWERLAFVLSARLQDPQFAGQTKERLSSRQAAGMIENVIHD